MKQCLGWAIKLNFISDHKYIAFAGIYYFGGHALPRSDGIRTAVFRTRKQAREAQKTISGRTSVTRVMVTIQEIKNA
jgi:hypothetical protein